MIWRSTCVGVVVVFLATSAKADERKNVMYEKVYPGGPDYKTLVEEFFAGSVFPEGLTYNGVGVNRDNVIAERVETNGRGGYWITVRARYSGRVLGQRVGAERVRVYYDNGGVRVDLGGAKGALNTRGIGKWIESKLPKKKMSGSNGGGNGGGTANNTVSFHYSIVNMSGRTVHFRLPSGREYSLQDRGKGNYNYSGDPSKATIVVRETGKTYRLKSGNHKFF